MIFAFQNYVMFNILSIYGILLSAWWMWFWTAAGLDLLFHGFNLFFVLDILAWQYRVVFWIFILLLIEIFIRMLFEKLDDVLENIKLPDKVLVAGLILLVLPALYWGLGLLYGYLHYVLLSV